MDIRTKLVFTLVAVSLLSMAVLGVFTVRTVDGAFRERTAEQLNGLAVFKQEAVEQVLAGWKERVALVASRTQLRISLEEFERTGSASTVARMGRILDDAASAASVFVELRVHDLEGSTVASAGAIGSGGPIDDRLLDSVGVGSEIRYSGIAFRPGDLPAVGFTAPLRSEDGQLLGHLHALLTTDELAALSDNYDGLGDTGETILVARDADGQVRTIHPVRFPPAGAGGAGFVLDGDGAAAQSLAGGEVRLGDDLSDYRDERVFIAARHITEPDWGLVVKIDEDEQALPIQEFRANMAQLAVTLAAFAILLGTFLGIRFAQPIHGLAETAARIAKGDLEARSGLQQQDEVGLLARTFDQMADSLEEQVELLSQFQRFFDVSIDMMCIASTDGYFKKINRACVRELGWSEEELLSRPFISFVHKDDVRATAREIQKLAGGTPTIRFTNRFLCMDGSYKRMRWNAYPEPETGRLYAIARVRSEQPDKVEAGSARAPLPESEASDAAAEASAGRGA
jgi:PAS domain S-box-containing protein